MQLKPLCPLLLLGLSQVAFAGPEQLTSPFGTAKRADIFGVGSRGLSKRATDCGTGFFECKDFAGSCCNDGTYCVMIGADVGCCPTGETCTNLVCQTFQTACGSDCCQEGVNCLTDSSGNQACDTSGSGGSSAISTLILTSSGTISSGPTSSGSSATPTGSSNTTSSSGSTTSKSTTTKKTTKKTTATDSSTPTSDSTSDTASSPTKVTPKITVSTQSVTPNAASFPTMAAMLGGGLGGIAAGYLAM